MLGALCLRCGPGDDVRAVGGWGGGSSLTRDNGLLFSSGRDWDLVFRRGITLGTDSCFHDNKTSSLMSTLSLSLHVDPVGVSLSRSDKTMNIIKVINAAMVEIGLDGDGLFYPLQGWVMNTVSLPSSCDVVSLLRLA